MPEPYPFLFWTFRERERIYDIFDDFAGHRFTVSHSRIGGVASDLTPEALEKIRVFIAQFPDEIRDWKKAVEQKSDLHRQEQRCGYYYGTRRPLHWE